MTQTQQNLLKAYAGGLKDASLNIGPVKLFYGDFISSFIDFIVIARKMDEKTLYDSEAELEWKCVNCGYIHLGKQPPTICPLCKKPLTWYMPVGLVK